ncbi:MAG: cell surface protein SprA, partial [Gemmatimonadales bacterium]
RLDVQVGTLNEEFVRYVFPIGDNEYHVRDGATLTDAAGRELKWRLYRIPFRQDTLQVGQPNLRQVEAARITMVAPEQPGDEKEFWIALARMRLTGAPWIKRAETPLRGLSGNTGVPRGEVIASVVTTENTDLGYEPPPGVGDLPSRIDQGVGISQVQINEKSLRLLATELQAGERAEAFIRFTGEGDKNVLNYRQLRVWARGRNEGWNEGDLEFYIKLGRDEHNFYLYRVPARTDTWEPEAVVELNRWLELRAVAERAYLSGAPPSGAAECGGDSTAYVACDGPYVVHVRDPATAPPNLAAVSEVAVGMFRKAETVAIPIAELWVDDIRVTNVLEETGTAAAIDVRLAAADVAEVNVSLSRRDDKFRQLGENATYITDAATRIGGLFRLDKLLPESWGLLVPVTAQYTRTTADPFYVSRTDLLAEDLPDLRDPFGSATSYQISVSRGRRGDTFLERTLFDPVSLAAGYDRSKTVTSLSSVETRNRQFRVGYALTPGSKTVAGAPKFLVNLVNSLPSWIRDSEFGKAINSSRLRWNPFQIRFTSTLTDNLTERTVYRVPIELPQDSLLRPLPSIVHLWRNDFVFELRPFSTFNLAFNYSSTRDLQDYGDSTTTGKLIELERRSLFGTDVGFERLNTLGTTLNVAPPVSSWLRPRFTMATSYTFNRDPNRKDPVRAQGDTAGAFKLPETLGNSRRTEVGVTLDIAQMGGDSGVVADLLGVLLPADFTYTRDLSSSFDRAPFESDLAYRFALGRVGKFRSQNGVLATSARDASTLLLTAGAQLPLDLQVRMTYRDFTATVWQRRGEEQAAVRQVNREWPSFTVSWAWNTPEAVRKVLSGILAQAQYRKQETSRTQPSALSSGEASGAGADVRTENNTTSFSPSLTLSWIGGVTTTGRYTTAYNEGITSGNVTQSDRKDWTGTVAFAFRPPRSLVDLRQRIQTSLSFNSSLLAVCLLRTGTDECRTVSDSRRQQFDVRMDTGFSSMLRAGISFSYIVTDQRHTSQKLTQTVFTLFGDLTLRAGEVR